MFGPPQECVTYWHLDTPRVDSVEYPAPVVRCAVFAVRHPDPEFLRLGKYLRKEHIVWIWYSGMRGCEHMTVRKKKKKLRRGMRLTNLVSGATSDSLEVPKTLRDPIIHIINYFS